MKNVFCFFFLAATQLAFSQVLLKLNNKSGDFPARIFDLKSNKYLAFKSHEQYDIYVIDPDAKYQMRILPPKDEDGFCDVYQYWSFKGDSSYIFQNFYFNNKLFFKCNIVDMDDKIFKLELRLIKDGLLDDVIVMRFTRDSKNSCCLDRLSIGPYMICVYEFGHSSPSEYRILSTTCLSSVEDVKWTSLPIIKPNTPLVKAHIEFLSQNKKNSSKNTMQTNPFE